MSTRIATLHRRVISLPCTCIVLVLCATACSEAAPSSNAGAGSSELESRLIALLDQLNARTSLYAKHLPSGREIVVRADEPMNTMSVIKVPAMVAAYVEAEAGRLSLDQRYTVTRADLRRGSGILQTFAPGLSPTVRDLIGQMIITSDNSATDIVLKFVGLDRVNSFLREEGFSNTAFRMTAADLFRRVWVTSDPQYASLSDEEIFARGFPFEANEEFLTRIEADSTAWLGRTTAREMAQLLERIYNGSLVSRDHSDEMIRILSEQLYASRLPRFLEFRATIAHKTGNFGPAGANDAGILIYEGGPSVVVVLVNQNRGDFVQVEEAIGQIALDVFTTWR